MMTDSSLVDWKREWLEAARCLPPSPALSAAERAELDSRLLAVMADLHCNSLLALDPAHFTYLSGVVQPYPGQFPVPQAAVIRTRNCVDDVILCPLDWVHLVAAQGWWGRIIPCAGAAGSACLMEEIARAVQELNPGDVPVGLDGAVLPADLVERLQAALPDVKWVECDPALRALRILKTPAEVKLIEEACRQADRAFVSALNHMEGNIHDPLGYDIWEFTERIRVHVGEFCGSGTGNLCTLQGADASLSYCPPRRGILLPGNLVRCEATNHHLGYWSDSGRTFVTGQPSGRVLEAYRQNIDLKKIALDALRPGAACKAVFQATCDAAGRMGVELWQEPGLGHGVGVSEREAPYLSADDDTVLQPGMVLNLAVYTFGPQRQLLCSKDTYEITESGSRLLSWYRNWDRLYVVTGDTARHG